MKFGNKIIGITIGQRSMLLAEVAQRGGKAAMGHFAEFVYPEGVSFAEPEKLGTALAQFWKQQHFSTREVIIGLPAKQLITRRKEVPAAPVSVAASTLRLQAEGEFSSELDNLAMDFAGTPSQSEPTMVLLIATNRKIIEQCEAFSRAAGLKLQAITSATAALGRASSRLPGGDGLVLNLGPAGVEMVVQHGADAAHIRHLNSTAAATPEAIGAMAGEIRRIMASIPNNGTPQHVALWKGPALAGDTSAGSLLEQRLSMPVTTPEVSSFVASDTREANAFAAPAAVALSAIEPAGLPVDFLHSRLAPPAPPMVSHLTLILIVLGLAIAVAVGYGFYDIGQLNGELSSLSAQRKRIKSDVELANLHSSRLDQATTRLPRDNFFNDVWNEISVCFPRNGDTIWATHLSNSGNDRKIWTLEGKARTEAEVRALADSLLRLTKQVPPKRPNDQPTVVPAFESAVVANLREDQQARGMYSFTIRITCPEK